MPECSSSSPAPSLALPHRPLWQNRRPRRSRSSPFRPRRPRNRHPARAPLRWRPRSGGTMGPRRVAPVRRVGPGSPPRTGDARRTLTVRRSPPTPAFTSSSRRLPRPPTPRSTRVYTRTPACVPPPRWSRPVRRGVASCVDAGGGEIQRGLHGAVVVAPGAGRVDGGGGVGEGVLAGGEPATRPGWLMGRWLAEPGAAQELSPLGFSLPPPVERREPRGRCSPPPWPPAPRAPSPGARDPRLPSGFLCTPRGCP